MANTYKNIVITPNTASSTGDPTIVFSGANASVNTDVTLRVYPDSNGTLSFEGSAGQLFSVTNDLTGSIFSVNDVSGIPLIEANVTSQVVSIGQFYSSLAVGSASAGGYKAQITGTFNATGAITQAGSQVLTAANYNSYAVAGAGYSTNQNLLTSSGPTFTECYNAGWWRNNNQGNGLYNGQSARGIYDPVNNAVYGNMSTYGTGLNSWQGWAIPGTFHFMGRSATDFGLYESQSAHWIIYAPYNVSYMGLNGSTTSASWSVYITGSLYCTSTINTASDRRIKENIYTIDNALDKVLKLRGVYYNRIKHEISEMQGRREIGLIAQEVDEVLPEVVTYAEDVDEYSVSYQNMAGLFVEAFKEQQSLIDQLRKEIDELKGKINGNN